VSGNGGALPPRDAAGVGPERLVLPNRRLTSTPIAATIGDSRAAGAGGHPAPADA